MRTYPDIRMRGLHKAFKTASEASDEGRHDDAFEGFVQLQQRLEALGLESGHVLHSMAIQADHLGQLAEAFDLMIKALRKDPFAPNAQHSFEVIVHRIRTWLRDAEPADEAIPRLYDLLARTSDADVDSHLVMARHFVQTDRLDRAAELLAAVTLTAPASRDAWLERARVAKLRGEALAAAEYEAQAAVRGMDDVAYGVPERGQN